MNAFRRPAPQSMRPRARLPLSTYLLSLAQGLNLTAAVISVTIAAVVGARLAPTPGWASFPYGMQFAAVMLFTYPAAILMRRHGRRTGFFAGATMLAVSGIVGYWSVANDSFIGLVVSHSALGAFIACANFYRFAAVEGILPTQKAKAISMVVSGGVMAAIAGPLLASLLRDIGDTVEFSLCYAALIGLSGLTFTVVGFLEVPNDKTSPNIDTISAPSGKEYILMHRYLIFVAVASAGVGYFIMNLLMIQASLVMRGLCSFGASSFAIQSHVLAMFLPSFFTGALISRFGSRLVLSIGFVLLALSSLTAVVQSPDYVAVVGGLLLLGLGWNFTYVAGGAMFADNVPPMQRHAWQGVNDTVIATCATAGAFLPAPLMAAWGYTGSNLFCLAIALCLALVGWLGIPEVADMCHEERSRVSN